VPFGKLQTRTPTEIPIFGSYYFDYAKIMLNGNTVNGNVRRIFTSNNYFSENIDASSYVFINYFDVRKLD